MLSPLFTIVFLFRLFSSIQNWCSHLRAKVSSSWSQASYSHPLASHTELFITQTSITCLRSIFKRGRNDHQKSTSASPLSLGQRDEKLLRRRRNKINKNAKLSSSSRMPHNKVWSHSTHITWISIAFTNQWYRHCIVKGTWITIYKEGSYRETVRVYR